jgi:ubiquinone/menaquinone biosynthesis C-methylase UbiE
MKNQDSDLTAEQLTHTSSTKVPDYLSRVYWWAYVHPKAVKVFERQWLVNLILWGNFTRLRNSALDTLGHTISGKTLQIACVYGDFTPRLQQRLAPDARLDVVDVLPIQLDNLDRKLDGSEQVRLFCSNSENLGFADNASYEQVILFFLLHELPEETRQSTLKEALRVLKPGGKLVVVDYHKPHAWNPLRYLMRPLLAWLEPFALAVWQRELSEFIPVPQDEYSIAKSTFFGALYQQVVFTRR